MRQSTMSHIAEDLVRYRIAVGGWGWVIYDSKQQRYVEDEEKQLLSFKSKGRALKRAERMNREGTNGTL